jgi:hypothetical protein
MPPREAIVQTGPSLGDDTADLAIGILHADQGSCMSRLPLVFTLAFLGMLLRLLSASTIAEDNRTGGGGGGGGGEYNEDCLFNNRNDDNSKYNDDNVEDRMGLHGWVDDEGESDDNGPDVVHGPSVGVVRRRILIVAPHVAAVDPSPLWSISSHRMPLVVINDVVDRG